jgi:NMD protein affecting ribosome stability and mRNA decay
VIEVNCGWCGVELDEPGGILFGIPDADETVPKRHLCTECYTAIVMTIETPKDIELPPCPMCGGELRLVERWTAKEVASFSVAGTTTKFPVYKTWWLVCDGCDFEEQGRHV